MVIHFSFLFCFHWCYLSLCELLNLQMFRVSLAAGHHKVLVNYMKCEQKTALFFRPPTDRPTDQKKNVNKAKRSAKKATLLTQRENL